MRLRPITVLALVAVLLGAGVGVGAADAGAAQDAEQRDGGDAAACDYASLYDRTIDSVVAIRAGDGLGSGFVYQAPNASAGANESVGTSGSADETQVANETAGADETAGANGTAAGNETAYVVTNAHVVAGTGSVVVQFARGDSRQGQVVGTDPGVDLAVVRVNDTPAYAEPLSVADHRPAEGTGVAAVGSPFGLEQTITHGIVSGLNRSMPTQQGFTIPDVVQTDAPINPGNSGGPLVACDGDVVGVNTAGISAQRAENVGFAVSGPTVERVAPALIERGEYDHSYLGVQTLPAGPNLLAANQVDATGGVYVHRVDGDGPASDALEGTDGYRIVDGQRVPVGGDLLVAVDGREVATGEELSSYLLAETEPGDTVTLTVVRDGERRDVEVTLGERPEPDATVGPERAPG